MSLCSPLGYSLLEETAHVARADRRRGNRYLRLADVLGPIFSNPRFTDLYPKAGPPRIRPSLMPGSAAGICQQHLHIGGDRDRDDLPAAGCHMQTGYFVSYVTTVTQRAAPSRAAGMVDAMGAGW